jgi:glycosyltransferase involved in cell wall biosynthesis
LTKITQLPLVGIITRTKNRTVLLRRAIESVLGQTYSNWVMIIVNDGGDPKEVDALVSEYSSSSVGRIRLIHHPQSLGMDGASKRGLESVDSELLIIHDDDDSWDPAFLTVAVNELLEIQKQFPNTQGVTTYSKRVVETIRGTSVTIESTESYNGWISKGFLSFDRVLTANPIPPISFLFTMKAFRELGSVYETVPILGDWEFLVRFMRRFDVYVIPQFLAFYHHRSALTSGAHGNSIVAQEEQHRLIRQYLLNTWLREDLESGKMGVGIYANLRTNLETLLNKAGVAPQDADSAHAQNVVDYYWDSPSWKATKPARSVAEKLLGLPSAHRPSVDNMKDAWTAAREVQESVSWNLTGPLRFLTACMRALRKS